MRKTVLISAAILFAIAISHQANAVNGPSFECNPNSRSPLAVVLCSSPEAAKADWEVSSSYWALNRDDRGESEFNRYVIDRCRLPSIETSEEKTGRLVVEELGRMVLGPGRPSSMRNIINDRHIACVVEAFNSHAREMRSKLSGDSLREANSSPEEHIAVQEDLISRGLLIGRVKQFGVKADGQFGPNTRLAIIEFQRSLREKETGYLTEEQRRSLGDTPERLAARQRAEETKKQQVLAEDAERAAAAARREKAQQEALENQRRAEEQKRQEITRQQVEKAAAETLREKVRLEALENQRRAEEQIKRTAEENERQKLEVEAARATEWRRRIEEAQKKGTEYANANDLRWNLQDRKNPMTDDTEYEVRSNQMNGAGALAQVEGLCLRSHVVFVATLLNEKDDKIPLGFVTSRTAGVVGRKRINDEPVFAMDFPNEKWRNKILLSSLSFDQEVAEAADTTWRVLAEIETSNGTLYIKISTFDPKIQKLVAACKAQWEIERRKIIGRQ